ncbi:MAG: serine protease [Solirubrobacteraceae bacterium]|nr:serine protease [Solirubrobacteraceae bacterium]
MTPLVCLNFRRSVRLRSVGSLAGCGGLLALSTCLAPAAGAEVTATAQAQIANAAFLVTAVPPGPAAGVCLVDSGVDANPDTSHVVARLAVEGDVGTDDDPTKHGTSMAMLMGAGRNGFGMVGLFPAVRVVSVRATGARSSAITPAGVLNAINRCTNESPGYGLRVIELALSIGGTLGAKDTAQFAAAVAGARANGLSVVAAAGNNAGGPVGNPASQPGVLSVGGSASHGDRCVGSASGAALLAPGCGLDEADSVTGNALGATSGTSQASALAAAALAALRSWRPELSAMEAERALIDSARAAPGGRLMDIAAAFRHLDLGAVVDANEPAAGARPSLMLPSSAMQARLPRPRVRVRAMRGPQGVIVDASNRPRGAVMVVSAGSVDATGRMRQVASRALRSRLVALRVTQWDELRVHFRDSTDARSAGPVTVFVHPRHRSPV